MAKIKKFVFLTDDGFYWMDKSDPHNNAYPWSTNLDHAYRGGSTNYYDGKRGEWDGKTGMWVEEGRAEPFLRKPTLPMDPVFSLEELEQARSMIGGGKSDG